MTVLPPIDDVELAGHGVAKHHHRLIREIHPHDRLTNGQSQNLGRIFGDNGCEMTLRSGDVIFGALLGAYVNLVLLAKNVVLGRLWRIRPLAIGEIAGRAR